MMTLGPVDRKDDSIARERETALSSDPRVHRDHSPQRHRVAGDPGIRCWCNASHVGWHRRPRRAAAT